MNLNVLYYCVSYSYQVYTFIVAFNSMAYQFHFKPVAIITDSFNLASSAAKLITATNLSFIKKQQAKVLVLYILNQ